MAGDGRWFLGAPPARAVPTANQRGFPTVDCRSSSSSRGFLVFPGVRRVIVPLKIP